LEYAPALLKIVSEECCVVKNRLKKLFAVGREFVSSNDCSNKLDEVQYSIDNGDNITDSKINLCVLVNKLRRGMAK
jgi:hypothetical protein